MSGCLIHCPSQRHSDMLVVVTSACVVHQLVGDDAVAPVSPRKLINQAKQRVGGREMQW